MLLKKSSADFLLKEKCRSTIMEKIKITIKKKYRSDHVTKKGKRYFVGFSM